MPLGQIQSQVSSTPYNSYQPQITSFLHQFEQFANNKSVRIIIHWQQTEKQKKNLRQRPTIIEYIILFYFYFLTQSITWMSVCSLPSIFFLLFDFWKQQQAVQSVRQSYQRHIQPHIQPSQTLQSLAVPPVIDRSTGSDLSNNGIMYQPNLNVVPPATGNGAVTLPHTNGLVNSTGYGTATVPQQPGVTPNLPQHPDVRLKKLAFFDVMATLLKPSTLIPTSNSQRMQEGTYYFHLTPQQATDIASNRYVLRNTFFSPHSLLQLHLFSYWNRIGFPCTSPSSSFLFFLRRDIRNSQKIEHIIQVQLRFCLLETTCEQEDYFPPNVIVKVNNKLCPLPVSINRSMDAIASHRNHFGFSSIHFNLSHPN